MILAGLERAASPLVETKHVLDSPATVGAPRQKQRA